MENNDKYFQLPIYYIPNKKAIESHICTDLNLYCQENSKDTINDMNDKTNKDNNNNNDNKKEVTNEENISVYANAFLPTSQFSKQTIPLWAKYFTANKQFLTDTQNLLKNDLPNSTYDYTQIEDIWNNINTETSFHEKYQYIDIPLFKWVNNNPAILQVISMYNITSPILALALPIFFLIIPFFLLRLKGITLSFSKYKEALYHIVSKHHLGQILSLGSVSWDKRIYILMTFGLYLLQTYQNFISCIQFYKHSKIIHTQVHNTKLYLQHTIENMNIMEVNCEKLQTYTPFITNMQKHKLILTKYLQYINIIPPFSVSLRKFIDLGRPMKAFYQLYNDLNLRESLQYSFGLCGYVNNLTGLQTNLKKKYISFCSFSKDKTTFKHAYYPPKRDNTISNTYNLNKHILLTGPNASGKTTLLKTTLTNIILSQQCGCGFYKKGVVAPYHNIYCYINIPDTSGRDSLFQAEARRCKDILDKIQYSSNKERHFCVFDELYSGTNPYEATSGAIAFLQYLNKNPNVKFFITTHYLDLCKKLDKINTIKNYHMETTISHENNKDNLCYQYKLKNNISTIQGGVKVLTDLGYPEEIINRTKEIMKTLHI